MPRKKPVTESKPITRFTGIETKISSIDQKLGTLKKADGTNVVPLGQISFGPNWQSAFGLSTLGTQIQAVLVAAGANAAKVHFVTVAGGGCEFLIAWDMANNRPQGAWQVSGEGNPFQAETPSTTVIPTANNHTQDIAFSGGGLARTVILSLNPSGSLAGDRIVVDCTWPAIAGIVTKFYSLSAVGTLLAQYTTDGVTLSGAFEFVFNNSSQWEYLEAQAPA